MRTALVTFIGILVVSIIPMQVSADASQVVGGLVTGMALQKLLTTGSTLKADAMCIPAITQCGCGLVMQNGKCVPGNNKYLCPCKDTTNSFTTTGFCQADNTCKATATGGGSGGGASSGLGLDKVAGILGQLMTQLMKPSPAAAPAAATTPATTGSTGCTTAFYITHVVSSDPCAQYVPSSITADTSGLSNSNVTSDLLNALNGTSGTTDTTTSTNTDTSNDVLSQLSDDGSVAAQAVITGQTSSTTLIDPNANNVFAQSVNLSGLSGDIKTLDNGATFVVGSRDTANNTEVAGFYGGDTTLGQPTGLVSSWCASRPWATNFLSNIIPPTFFDGLCTLRGYTVGSTVTATSNPGTSQVTITQSPIQPVQTQTTVAATSSDIGGIVPTVDIWASPATVSLGARTSIFWTSSNAASCTVTSPDGSFSQHTLTGGASTVAITTATVYTISCLGPDGAHATKNVTVQLAI